MTTGAKELKRVMRTYGRQLTYARRVTRYARALRGAGAEDEILLSRAVRRRATVEQVSREIVENLVSTGSENPVVLDILAVLEADFGEKFDFHYPPADVDLKIFRETPDGPAEVTGDDKNAVLNRLWEITLAVVDQTML